MYPQSSFRRREVPNISSNLALDNGLQNVLSWSKAKNAPPAIELEPGTTYYLKTLKIMI